MKKILFISGSLGGGGAERVLTLVANQLLKKGYDISIIAFMQSNEPYENQCPVTVLPFHNTIDQMRRLRKLIAQAKPDTIIAFEYHIGMKTILAAHGLPYRIIVSERSDPHTLDRQPLKKILRNFLYQFTDILVCQTEDAKKYFSHRIQQKAVVLCNPIKEGLPLWNHEESKKIIANFCRIEKAKNIPLLIDAFHTVYEKYPDFQLWLIGNGTESNAVIDLVKEKNLEKCVKLHPFSDDVHRIVRNCYMFVSSSDYEGISNSMLEAMAMGMPVVCTDCPIGGARMVIKNDYNGILVPPKDAAALASAMVELISNTQKAVRLANNAQKIYEQLSLDKITNKWIEIL